MQNLSQRVVRMLRERQFTRVAGGVLATPPVEPREDGVVLFSMIGTRVLLPYLVAIKSLHGALGRGRVIILDDGTLTLQDRRELDRHLGGPQVIPIAGVDTGPCPRGGTWERLLSILDLRRSDYVIQLDSDTVTLGALPEVEAALAAGRSFTLAGGLDSAVLPLAGIAARAAAVPAAGRVHVQAAIERVIDRIVIPGADSLRYVRGCSGFAGFAPDPRGRALAEAFSVQAAALVGCDRWREWGTEQVTSNFVIANDPAPLLLPPARYRNYWADADALDAPFLHFLGTWRYHGRMYERAAARAIAARMRQAAAA